MRLDRKKAMRSFWKDMSILSMVDSPTAMTNHGRFWKKSFSRSYALGMDSEETLHDSPGRMYHYHEWFTSFTRSGHCSDSPVVIEIHRNHCFFWWSMPKASEVLRDLKSKDSWWSTLEECETHVVNANKTSSWGCNATNAIKCRTLVFQFPCWPAMASLFQKNFGRCYLCIISTLPLLTFCQLSITFQKPSSPKITEIAPRFWSSWWSTSPKHVWIQSENLAKICLNR